MRDVLICLLTLLGVGFALACGSSTPAGSDAAAESCARGACAEDAGRRDAGDRGDAAIHRDGSGDATTHDAPISPDAQPEASRHDAPSSDGTAHDAPSEACALSCSPDQTSVIDCHGVVQPCPADEACDPTSGACTSACQAFAHGTSSVGCDYYATHLEVDLADACFAAYVVNTSGKPVHIDVEFYPGTPLGVSSFARIPSGVGTSITYGSYDDVAGLPPGQTAILFLSGSAASTDPCPPGVVAAVPSSSVIQGSGTTQSFHIMTDAPVAAYQMNPYGAGAAGVPGASLLLPTSAWGTNYVLVTAAPLSVATMGNPSVSIVALQDDTNVTILPSAAIAGGGTLPSGPANTPYQLMMNKGEQAQLSQFADLSGSILQATAPVGVLAGNACMQVPDGTSYCDHGEQMIPPVRAVGSAYAAVMFRPRVTGDVAIWRVVGMASATQLTYSAIPAGAPTTLGLGDSVSFTTDQPFTVASQDAAHPFALFEYMTGSADTSGYGDPDFVMTVPPSQFLTRYSFFADPTFPENDLVVIRAKDASMQLDDVTLDCAGVLTGWQAIGAYEWTRIDLLRHDFAPQGACSAGTHTITSQGPFGVTVWGWGTPETTSLTGSISYGYPAGMNLAPLNAVVIPPVAQ